MPTTSTNPASAMPASKLIAELRDLARSIPDSGEALAAASADSARRQALTFGVGELDLDLSRQTITHPQFTHLIQLAEAQNVLAACLAMQEGAVVNTSENRPARQAQTHGIGAGCPNGTGRAVHADADGMGPLRQDGQ